MKTCDACGNPEAPDLKVRRAVVHVSFTAQWSGLEEDGEREEWRCEDCTEGLAEWVDGDD